MSETTITPASASVAFLITAEVKQLAREIEVRFFRLGELLARVRDERLFLAAGADSFEAWLADPEIGLSHTQAFRVLRVHGLRSASVGTPLVTDGDLLAMGIARADMVRPRLLAATTADERAELVARATQLSVSDLRRELLADEGLDIDSLWRAPLEHLARELRRVAYQLEGAADAERAAALIDGLVCHGLKVRAGLETEGAG